MLKDTPLGVEFACHPATKLTQLPCTELTSAVRLWSAATVTIWTGAYAKRVEWSPACIGVESAASSTKAASRMLQFRTKAKKGERPKTVQLLFEMYLSSVPIRTVIG